MTCHREGSPNPHLGAAAPFVPHVAATFSGMYTLRSFMTMCCQHYADLVQSPRCNAGARESVLRKSPVATLR